MPFARIFLLWLSLKAILLQLLHKRGLQQSCNCLPKYFLLSSVSSKYVLSRSDPHIKVAESYFTLWKFVLYIFYISNWLYSFLINFGQSYQKLSKNVLSFLHSNIQTSVHAHLTVFINMVLDMQTYTENTI